MKFKLLSLAIALIALVAAAHADDAIPRFDVPGHCKTVAEFGGTHSAMMEQQCIKMEQADYDALKPRWAELPASVKEHCVQIAGFGGQPSYMMLSQCVKMELEAGNAGTEFKF